MSAADLPRKSVQSLDRRMAYAEIGRGPTVVFLHGNPTSAYLWRNVMPALASRARCVAPDLIGMGQSDKLPGSDIGRYRFAEHYRYLDAALQALDLGRQVTLVLHDWGSALGFHWATQHANRVRGIAYMEALVRPLTWSEWPEVSRGLFQALRSPKGDDLILERNVFIERILPGSIIRKLSEDEMNVYRRPFAQTGDDRQPMLAWPRELPIDGEPADIVAIVRTYSEFMATSPVPKLFINAEPGAILTGAPREFCRGWRNQKEITVQGIHFIQEDSPAEIGAALSDWYAGLPES